LKVNYRQTGRNWDNVRVGDNSAKNPDMSLVRQRAVVIGDKNLYLRVLLVQVRAKPFPDA
jgi:hypothetical protein